MGILSARKLVKEYGGRRVVNGLDLDICTGEVVGLLGPNGAGKTTTFYMVVGLVKPDGGQILLDGEDISSCPMYIRARKGINYLPQEPSIFRKLTVAENILAVLETLDLDEKARAERLGELLAELDLTALAHNPAYSLSGGERRRVEITRALVTMPRYILLDEPFAGIDPIALSDIRELVVHLRDRGLGVLITDHNVRATLEIVDRAYIIHDGKVLMEGPPDEIVTHADVRRVYLGDEFKM